MKLPPTCKLPGQLNVNACDIISVIVVEAESCQALQPNDIHHLGWRGIDWHATTDMNTLAWSTEREPSGTTAAQTLCSDTSPRFASHHH